MDRRQFLIGTGGALLGLAAGEAGAEEKMTAARGGDPLIRLFLCGDVMTGRGIDQVLPHPSDPRLFEPWVKNALRYVELAEAAHGPIPRPVPFPYVWGDALEVLERTAPDLRLVNLETAVTRSDDAWQGKGIHYRMHPGNVACLTAAGIDCCALANNHVLDWGFAGLEETLATLRQAGLAIAGAGGDERRARAPATLEVPGKGRVHVFSCGVASSGIPRSWAAAAARPGIDLLPDLSPATVGRLADAVAAVKRPDDLAVVSIHWGGNWGYGVPAEHRRFAHGLIDRARVDLIHGHSSHHPLGIEVHGGRPILYGCGDFLNDYEGIGGHEEYRPNLVLGYLASLEPATGRLARLDMVPFRLRRFRPERAAAAEAEWLGAVLSREGETLGTRVEPDGEAPLSLRWQ